jgi:hypothetical protein
MGNIKPRRWRWWINAEEFCTSLVSKYALLEGPVHGRAELRGDIKFARIAIHSRSVV